MILAAHVILSAYGFWLPNDPRGSWSNFVRSYELYQSHGPATKVNTHRSVAHIPHDSAARLAAKQSLLFPPVRFTGTQARCVALAFARAAASCSCPIYACAVLPDHAHLVIGRPDRPFDQFISRLKELATKDLIGAGLHPLARYAKINRTPPSPWARKWWKVFVDDEPHVQSAIRYVQDNPIKSGLPRQDRWSFVSPFPYTSGPLARR